MARLRIFEYKDGVTAIHVVDDDNTLWQTFSGPTRKNVEQQVQEYARTYNMPIEWPQPASFESDKMPDTEAEVEAILAPLIVIATGQADRYLSEGLSISVEERFGRRISLNLFSRQA